MADLRDRYAFERELGRGGMATVYLALAPRPSGRPQGAPPAQAVERLEVVLAHPSLRSRGRLRIDPHFAPLRGDPAFQRLLQGKS